MKINKNRPLKQQIKKLLEEKNIDDIREAIEEMAKRIDELEKVRLIALKSEEKIKRLEMALRRLK